MEGNTATSGGEPRARRVTCPDGGVAVEAARNPLDGEQQSGPPCKPFPLLSQPSDDRESHHHGLSGNTPFQVLPVCHELSFMAIFEQGRMFPS